MLSLSTLCSLGAAFSVPSIFFVQRHVKRSKPLLRLVGLLFVAPLAIAQTDDAVMEEVIVTGLKVERSLQDTAASVAVSTAIDIENYNLNTLDDVFLQTANVIPRASGTAFTIRGISNTNVTGTGIGDLATIYVDSAPIPRDFVQAGRLTIWDLDQVEILRGPQSTLQGRNALAGSVIINTATPAYENSGKLQVQAADQLEERRVGLVGNVVIVDEQVALRIAVEQTETLGEIFNPTLDDYASTSDSTLIRAKLLIEPEQIDDLSIVLSQTLEDRTTGQITSFLEAPLSSFSNRNIFSNVPFSQESSLELSIVNVDYDLSSTTSLSSITTYSKVERARTRDTDFTAEGLQQTVSGSDPKTITQELRITHEGENVSGVLGLYYSDLDDSNGFAFSTQLLTTEQIGLAQILQGPPELGGFGLDADTSAFVVSQYEPGIVVSTSLSNPNEIETQAIFGDLTWNATDRIRILAGFRYDRERQNIGNEQLISIAQDLPNPDNFGALAPLIQGINADSEQRALAANSDFQEGDTDFDAFLPKIGLSYNLLDQGTINVVIQRGYRSGGAGVNQARASVHTFEQEFTWNYELSWRSQWLNNRLTANANVFFIDWQDQQITQFLSANVFDSETTNVGSSTLSGAEVELNYQVSPKFQLFTSLGYVETEIEEFESPLNGLLLNNEFAQAPTTTFALGGLWEANNGFYASLDLNHSSERFSRIDLDQSLGQDIPARTLVNTKLGYRNEQYGAYVVITNLLNEEYIDASFQTNQDDILAGTFGESRVIGVNVQLNF